MKETKLIEIVNALVNIIHNQKLNENEIIEVISTLLFSIGSSLERCGEITSEEVLTNFATTPTLGGALMAQALYMKETWIKNERKETHDRTDHIQGKTED